jgi:hypothetical protein
MVELLGMNALGFFGFWFIQQAFFLPGLIMLKTRGTAVLKQKISTKTDFQMYSIEYFIFALLSLLPLFYLFRENGYLGLLNLLLTALMIILFFFIPKKSIIKIELTSRLPVITFSKIYLNFFNPIVQLIFGIICLGVAILR